MRSASCVTDTGSATRAPGWRSATSATSASSAWSGASDMARVVDDRGPLAVGRRSPCRGRCPTPARARRSARPALVRIADGERHGARERVHREHVGAELRQHRRHDERRGAVRVVEHHLEPALAQPARVDAALRAPRCRTRASGAGTRCRRCRRRTRGGSPRGAAAARSCAGVLASMSRPSVSKKRISTLLGSSGASRTVMPPSRREFRTWNRVSGTVASSTSSTLTPERFSPPMIDALRARGRRGSCRGSW